MYNEYGDYYDEEYYEPSKIEQAYQEFLDKAKECMKDDLARQAKKVEEDKNRVYNREEELAIKERELNERENIYLTEEECQKAIDEKVKRYKVLSKHPNDEFIDLQVGVKLDSHQVVRFLNESYNYIEELRKENRKLAEELNKYKETVQELQESNGRMFDEMLKIRCGEQ